MVSHPREEVQEGFGAHGIRQLTLVGEQGTQASQLLELSLAKPALAMSVVPGSEKPSEA